MHSLLFQSALQISSLSHVSTGRFHCQDAAKAGSSQVRKWLHRVPNIKSLLPFLVSAYFVRSVPISNQLFPIYSFSFLSIVPCINSYIRSFDLCIEIIFQYVKVVF